MSKKQKCPALTFLYFCLELFVIGVKATKSSIFNNWITMFSETYFKSPPLPHTPPHPTCLLCVLSSKTWFFNTFLVLTYAYLLYGMQNIFLFLLYNDMYYKLSYQTCMIKRPISTKRMSFPNKKNNQIEQDLTFWKFCQCGTFWKLVCLFRR